MLLTAAPDAHAGLVYTLLTRARPKGERSQIRTDRIFVAGDRMRMETGEGPVTLVDLASRTFWTVARDGKTYERTSLDELEQQFARIVPPELLQEVPLSLECLQPGGSAEGCRDGRYRARRPDRVTVIEVRPGLEGAAELEAFLRKLARTTAALPVFDRVSAIQAWRDERLTGFPVRTEEHLFGSGETVWREVSLARNIRRAKLPESLFQPPSTAVPSELVSR